MKARFATMLFAATLTLAAHPANAQWRILAAPTQANLGAVSAVDDMAAWAAGASGTVVRTEDGGRSWKVCAPSMGDVGVGAIEAFDKDTAIVMTTGGGRRSALYKTSDGCRTWKKVLENPDQGGGFKALRRESGFDVYLLGDPVDGKFVVYVSRNGGESWTRDQDPGLAAPEGSRVAGPGALTNVLSLISFGTTGAAASIYTYAPICHAGHCSLGWSSRAIPQAAGNAPGEILSLAGRNVMVQATGTVTGIGTMPATTIVAIGDEAAEHKQGWAYYSGDGGLGWKAASAAPGGRRSAVAFDGDRGRFIAVGEEGTDSSVDDGLIWQPLRPREGEAADADKGWSALSLPFVVGAHGRIGRLSDAP